MRKEKLLSCAILLVSGFVCLSCTNTAAGDHFSIDVAAAFANPVELSASDYFSEVRYVPLETTEQGLVGSGADIQCFGDKLVVTTRQKQCLLFDARTGRFIRSIGHIGNDPEGNKSVSCWIDPFSLTLHLEGWNGDWQQYDNQGAYMGKTAFPVQRSIGTAFMPVDAQTVAVYQPGFLRGHGDSLFFFRDGREVKRMTAYRGDQDIAPFDQSSILGISVMHGDNPYGLWGPAAMTGAMVFDLKDDAKGVFFDGVTHLWRLGEALYCKHDQTDTIFQVKDMTLIPVRVFSLGAYHWPVEERFTKEADLAIYISHILESEDLMVFRLSHRMLSTEDVQTYTAMYDKHSGQLKINGFADGIRDDVSYFLPLQPRCVSPSGEYVGLLPAADVSAWFEEHPDRIASLPKEVQQLKQVEEEDNPVIVFMK